MRRLAVCTLGFCSLLVPTVAAAALVADYQFQNVLTSDVAGAPALTSLGPGANSFASETVDGLPRTVLTFPEGNGLSLAPTAGVVPSGNYTLHAVLRLADVSGYRKIADLLNGTSDTGLYNQSGNLRFYNEASGAGAPIVAGQYFSVTLTRDDITDDVVGYIDGAQEATFVDSGDLAVIDGSNTLRFFIDDETNGGEESAGAVACLRLYDTALSGEEIAALPPCDPTAAVSVVEVPALRGAGVASLVALLATAGLAVLKTARG